MGDFWNTMDPVDQKPVNGKTEDLLQWLNDRRKCNLELADCTMMQGFSFGATTSVSGEVVFNTGMVGYPESSQILRMRGRSSSLPTHWLATMGFLQMKRTNLDCQNGSRAISLLAGSHEWTLFFVNFKSFSHMGVLFVVLP